MKIDKSVFIHGSAVLIGDIEIGKNSSIWPNVVIRGDFNKIRIGEHTNIQDNSVVHAGIDSKVVIGNYVLVGHSCVIHGCIIENNVLVGMNSTILDGAKVGSNTVIGANTLILENASVPRNSIVMGSPAKIKKGANRTEYFIKNAILYYDLAKLHKKHFFPWYKAGRSQ